MKKVLTFLGLIIIFQSIFAQGKPAELERPRLVVGIVVDQMRWDYLVRYSDRYGSGGFNRLMRDGYNCNRLLINYLPTVTAVGHTSVYTGSVPAFTGIIANHMKIDGKWGSSVDDMSCQPLGTTSKVGQASPHKLLVTTMTDELRLATNFRSKVIGVALKDRAAILPAGHSANAAYWLDGESMDFVSSSYYMETLPKWVKAFNSKKLGMKYLEKVTKEKKGKGDPWALLYDEKTYVQSAPKGRPYEGKIGHTMMFSPYGNTYTLDMAQAAIEGEQLGHNPAGVPDFLAVSLSSTDMIGHEVGPNSIWIEDVYLRLDKELESFFNYLDRQVGKGEYVVFLTADHAGSHNVEFRREHHLPAGTWPYYRMQKAINEALRQQFASSSDLVETLESNNVFFYDEAIAKVKPAGESFDSFKQKVKDAAIKWLTSQKQVAYAFDCRHIPDYVPEPVRSMAINGYNPKRSGDIQIVLEANHTEDYDDGYKVDWNGIVRGTNHSVWSPYDAHIPFVIMGKGVHHAWDNRTYHIVDIAPTITALLNIQQPSGAVGDAIDVRK